MGSRLAFSCRKSDFQERIAGKQMGVFYRPINFNFRCITNYRFKQIFITYLKVISILVFTAHTWNRIQFYNCVYAAVINLLILFDLCLK